jgi:O-acetyl-ADP-ribose deacetylase (regulator of RNase III)
MHYKVNGKVQPGQVFVSKAGRMPCKFIIHAVGPTWRGDKRNEENLYTAVTASLQEASGRLLHSIAIPAICVNIHTFPLYRASKVMLGALVDFLKEEQSTSVKEVHIVDNDSSVIRSFEKELKSLKIKEEEAPVAARHGRRGGSGRNRDGESPGPERGL